MSTNAQSDLARVAGLIGDPTRAAMLTALLGGQALPAGELARRAGVSAPTASEHLLRLTEHGLLTRRRSGRHSYYALAGEDVAAALEVLSRVAVRAGPAGGPARSNRAARPESPETQALRFARTCYDHLAGALGVLVADALRERAFLSDGFEVTPAGEAWLQGLDVDVAALRLARRPLARPCLDWTERRDHLAGAAGAALTATMLERRWLARIDGTRAVRLTLRGREGLYRALGVEIEQPR